MWVSCKIIYFYLRQIGNRRSQNICEVYIVWWKLPASFPCKQPWKGQLPFIFEYGKSDSHLMLSWEMTMEVFTFPAAWQLRYQPRTWSPSVPFFLPEALNLQLKKQSSRNGRIVSLWYSCGSRDIQSPRMTESFKCRAKGIELDPVGIGPWGALFGMLHAQIWGSER